MKLAGVIYKSDFVGVDNISLKMLIVLDTQLLSRCEWNCKHGQTYISSFHKVFVLKGNTRAEVKDELNAVYGRLRTIIRCTEL